MSDYSQFVSQHGCGWPQHGPSALQSSSSTAVSTSTTAQQLNVSYCRPTTAPTSLHVVTHRHTPSLLTPERKLSRRQAAAPRRLGSQTSWPPRNKVSSSKPLPSPLAFVPAEQHQKSSLEHTNSTLLTYNRIQQQSWHQIWRNSQFNDLQWLQQQQRQQHCQGHNLARDLNCFSPKDCFHLQDNGTNDYSRHHSSTSQEHQRLSPSQSWSRSTRTTMTKPSSLSSSSSSSSQIQLNNDRRKAKNKKQKEKFACDVCHEVFDTYNEAEIHERTCQDLANITTTATNNNNISQFLHQDEVEADVTIKEKRDDDGGAIENDDSPKMKRRNYIWGQVEDDRDEAETNDDVDHRNGDEDNFHRAGGKQRDPDGGFDKEGESVRAKKWICEICEKAQFDDYTQAVKHEVQCRKQVYLKQMKEHQKETLFDQSKSQAGPSSSSSRSSSSSSNNSSSNIRSKNENSTYGDTSDDESSSPVAYYGADDYFDESHYQEEYGENSIIDDRDRSDNGDFEHIKRSYLHRDSVGKQLMEQIMEKTRQLYLDDTNRTAARATNGFSNIEQKLNCSKTTASAIVGTNTGTANAQRWLCAVCRVRSFNDYTIACEHEKECNLLQYQHLCLQQKQQELERYVNGLNSSSAKQNQEFRSFRYQIEF